MAGMYLNEVILSLQNWVDTNTLTEDSWHRNNLHIDEIKGVSNISRSEWVNIGLAMIDISFTHLRLPDSLMLFLHIELKSSSKKMSIQNLSLDWLKEKIDRSTPPSFNFTSIEYYTDFYEKELIACSPDNSLLNLVQSSVELDFFYRNYYHPIDKTYSRAIYIFPKRRGDKVTKIR